MNEQRGYSLTAETRGVICQMAQLKFEGHIIPHSWWKRLKYANGKPNTNAALILSDIVYWYRPILVVDEGTGAVQGYRKRFKGDLLQRSYQDLANRFGLTKRQAKEACDYLKQEIGVIGLVFRHITAAQGKPLANVMYISLNVEVLKQLTFDGIGLIEDDDAAKPETQDHPTPERDMVLRQNVGLSHVETQDHPTPERRTYTKTTTETTDKDLVPDADAPSPTPPTQPSQPSKKKTSARRTLPKAESDSIPPAPVAPPTPEQVAADAAVFDALESAAGQPLPPPTGKSKEAIERALDIATNPANDERIRRLMKGEVQKWGRYIRENEICTADDIMARCVGPEAVFYTTYLAEDGEGGLTKPPTPGAIAKWIWKLEDMRSKLWKPVKPVMDFEKLVQQAEARVAAMPKPDPTIFKPIIPAWQLLDVLEQQAASA